MIRWLSGDQTATYAHLATEAVAFGLPHAHLPTISSPHDPDQLLFAAGLGFAGMPAALAVLRQDPRSPSADVTLLSLVVVPQLQGLGLARELLTWLRAQAQQLMWDSISVSYPLDHACTVAMNRLTQPADGWHHSAGLRLLQLDRNGAMQLLQRLHPLVRHAHRSARFDLIAWGDLPVASRNALGQALDAPAWARPGDDHGHDPLHALDWSVSTVLTDHQHPVGWLMAHRVGPRLFRVSQWWVVPELQGSGAALLLLHRALKGALASANGYQVGTFGMEPGNTMAIRLCERKIAPFASGMSQQCRAHLRVKLPMAG